MEASRCRALRVLIALLFISCPFTAEAVGEYDGMWTGQEKVYVGGEPPETGYTAVIIYQPNQTELFISDDIVGSIRLVRSGSQWVLPAPIDTTYMGLYMVVKSMKMGFPTTTKLSGEIRASVDTGSEWIDVKATFVSTKQTCSALSSGVPVRNLSGKPSNDRCFQINVPQRASKLSARTYDGAGNAELAVYYSRPDFKTVTSDGYDNNENVTISAPQAGRWYLLLYTCESYSGLTLTVSYETLPAPKAGFSAAPTAGRTPLSVRFSDQSTGGVTSWSWNFGDGSTSKRQSPTHTYRDPGVYTVELTASGPGGSDTEIKTDLILVEPRKALPWLPLLLGD